MVYDGRVETQRQVYVLHVFVCLKFHCRKDVCPLGKSPCDPTTVAEQDTYHQTFIIRRLLERVRLGV
jgi:hypothetical protein